MLDYSDHRMTSVASLMYLMRFVCCIGVMCITIDYMNLTLVDQGAHNNNCKNL